MVAFHNYIKNLVLRSFSMKISPICNNVKDNNKGTDAKSIVFFFLFTSWPALMFETEKKNH